jgi:hypothetical protein
VVDSIVPAPSHLDSTFGNQLDIFPLYSTLGKGNAKIAFGGVAPINIGMVKSGQAASDAMVHQFDHFFLGKLVAPTSPRHGSRYDPGKIPRLLHMG